MLMNENVAISTKLELLARRMSGATEKYVTVYDPSSYIHN